MKGYNVYVAPPCPQCGKDDAARMGSTEWGHGHYCCSKECGLAFRSNPKRFELDLGVARHKAREAAFEVERLETALEAARRALTGAIDGEKSDG